MALPRVLLKARRARPFFGLHPWVYAGAVEAIDGEPADGDVVDLVSSTGTFVARGLYNSQSKIRVRLLTWSEAEAIDEAFFRRRLQAAIALRRDSLRLMGPGRACRLVYSEADGLSGLIVDQYDRWLCLQFTSLGMALRRDLIANLLRELTQAEGIVLRTEKGVGKLEGLELHDQILSGTAPDTPITIEENGLQLLVHLTEGQKTGTYLDQRDNRQIVAQLAIGRRMLDAFCYSGGFGLHAARAGASSVHCVDGSEPALSLARANAEANHFANITFEKSDIFVALDRLVDASEKFGVVVLDPPKFARSGNAVDEALRGYRRIISQALKLLDSGGILVMCCCSGLITREMLHELLAQVSADARRLLQILESRGPAPDHPVAATCPESAYLKCVICRLP